MGTARAWRFGGFSLAAALMSTAIALSAMAQPSAAEKATARGLVKDGRAKLEGGDTDGALADFRAAHEIMHVPTTGLALGKAQSKAGMLVEALDTLLAVARMKQSPREPAAFRRARDEAKKLAKKLAPRVPSLRVQLTGDAAAGASVTVDGNVLASEVVGAAYKVNPGVHDVVATSGEVEERARVALGEGEAREVVLHLTMPPEPPPPTEDDGATHPLVWAGIALAGAATVAGSVTGALALDKHAEVAPRCPESQCPPDTHDELDAGVTLGTVSTIMFVAAGVGAAAAVVGLFLPYDDGVDDDQADGAAWLRLGPTGIVFGGNL